MPNVGAERELDRLLAASSSSTRYLDLCLALRRPMARIQGQPGRRLDGAACFEAAGVTVRLCRPLTLPESGEALVPVSSAPEAPGASARIPAGAALVGPVGLVALFEPEEILRAGGSWDRLRKGWAPARPARAHVIDLEESQIEFVRWFSAWLRAFRLGEPRDDSAAIVYGGRRGGKTFACLCCLLAAAIDVPDLLGWAVSVSHVERDVDIDRNVKRLIPADWYTYREWPAHKFHLINGSTITNVSADDPEGAKRGQVDLVLINEGAKMAGLTYENALGGTADRGGIVLVASNPPQTSKGEWVEREVTAAAEAVAKGEEPDARVFKVDWRLNRSIDHGARKRIGRILRRLNPALAEADDEGNMKPVGDRALYAWSKVRHGMRPLPDLGEITAPFMRAKGCRPYDYLLTLDFQRRPWIIGLVWRIYDRIEAPDLWCTWALAVEGNEDDFLDALESQGGGKYHGLNTLIVADATGIKQNYAHEWGKTSWGPLSARGFEVQGPHKKNTWINPLVETSLGQTNRLLTEGRIHVVPDLPLIVSKPAGVLMLPDGVAVAARDCRAKPGKHGLHAVGEHAHLVDTIRYAAWWADPPKEAARTGIRLSGGAAKRR